MKIRTSSLALLLLGTAHGAWAASTQSATVEFFNQNLQHYFVTADAAEALAIDSGAAGPGWVRTGRSFNIFADTGAAPAGAVPVCRFYSKGSNGHFYTADAAECAQLKSLQVTQQAAAAAAGQPFTGWTFESVAFAAAMPSGGSCAAGSEPVYRFMSAGAQSGSGVNHRFVTGSDMAGVMQDRGWTAEGIALCSPVNSTGTSAPAAPVTNSFPELVATWTGNGRYGYQTLPGGTPTRGAGPLSLAIADDGTITGTAFGCTATGAITAGDGFHSLYTGTLATAACTDTNLIGSFTLHLEREGTTTIEIEAGGTTDTLRVGMQAELSSGTPPPPPVASGPTTYSGNAAWIVQQKSSSGGTSSAASAVNLPLSLTIDGTTLTGSGGGCTFAGTLQQGNDGYTGTASATGCTDPAFNGAFTTVKLGLEDGAALEVDLEKSTTANGATTRAMIRGALTAGGSTPPPPPVPTIPVGTWNGNAGWAATAIGAAGTTAASSAAVRGALSLAIDAAGQLTGTGQGCTFAGQVQIVQNAIGGSVTATGCTDTRFNGTYDQLALQLTDDGALRVSLHFQTATLSVTIAGVLEAGGGGSTPPPVATIPVGTWTGNAQWLAVSASTNKAIAAAVTAPLQVSIAAGGVLTGSGQGCTLAGQVNVSGDNLTGNVTATGCTDTNFNGTYNQVGLELTSGGALAIGLRRETSTVSVTIAGVLPSGTTAPTPTPTPPPSFSLAGTWTGNNVEWAFQKSGTSGGESVQALTLTITTAGAVTGSGYGCALTGTLAPMGTSTTAFTGSLAATGCTDPNFNGTYPTFGARAEDGNGLEVGFARRTTANNITVQVEVGGTLTKQ